MNPEILEEFHDDLFCWDENLIFVSRKDDSRIFARTKQLIADFFDNYVRIPIEKIADFLFKQ